MAERRKNRKKKEQPEAALTDGKPPKEEYAVAKYLREKLPEKKTSLLGHKVDYFIASKAIDCLLDSPWATKSDGKDALFTTRESVVLFMDRMLQHKFFHRAKKIIVQKEPKKKKGDDSAADSVKEKEKAKLKEKAKDKNVEKLKGSEKEKGREKEQEKEKDSAEDKEGNGDEDDETKKGKSKDEASDEKQKDGEKGDKKEAEVSEKKKEKKKLKLDMHLEQLFLDGSEVYVWIYDPIPVRTWIIGMLMVIGAVLVCLFPLWPQVIRHYIYYISVAAALFLVFIIGLAIIRLIVFIIIWALTFGKHHLWLLPNLTADVGFFESFWPLYEYEYKGAKKEEKKEKEKKSKSGGTKSAKGKAAAPATERSDSSSDQEKKGDQANNSESEHDSEDDKGKTETTADNGFEILETNEAEEVDEQQSEAKQPA